MPLLAISITRKPIAPMLRAKLFISRIRPVAVATSFAIFRRQKRHNAYGPELRRSLRTHFLPLLSLLAISFSTMPPPPYVDAEIISAGHDKKKATAARRRRHATNARHEWSAEAMQDDGHARRIY